MKIQKNQPLLWVFLASTFLNGVLWEGIGWIALLFIMISGKGIRNSLVLSWNEVKVLILMILIAGYVVLQVCALHLNITETIRLYGITKTVSAFLIVYFFMNPYIKTHDVIREILPLLFIVNWLYIVYLVTDIKALNVIGGSRNYLGAINVLFVPYILKFLPKEKRSLKIFWIGTLVLLALFIGSRTTLATIVIAFLLTGLLEDGIEKKFKALLLAMSGFLLILILLPVLGKNANFSRAISILTTIADKSRSDLADSMWNQFYSYSNMQQLIGNGNNLITWREAPPHNFIYELLLCYGKIGTFAFLAGIVITIVIILKSDALEKKYCVLVICITLIVGLVQPFITSGYFFQCLVAMVTLALWNRDNCIARSS